MGWCDRSYLNLCSAGPTKLYTLDHTHIHTHTHTHTRQCSCGFIAEQGLVLKVDLGTAWTAFVNTGYVNLTCIYTVHAACIHDQPVYILYMLPAYMTSLYIYCTCCTHRTVHIRDNSVAA